MTAPNVAQIPLEPIVFPIYFTINENPMYKKQNSMTTVSLIFIIRIVYIHNLNQKLLLRTQEQPNPDLDGCLDVGSHFTVSS